MNNTTEATTKSGEIQSERTKTLEPAKSLIPHQSLFVIKSINKAKFPVYLVGSKTDQQKYAMKVFFYNEEAPNLYFQNEIRFSSLKHPNIINTIQHQETIEARRGNEVTKTSYTLMEYAPHEDFFSLIMKHRDHLDEKLIRTYFRQLIEGIQHLHQNKMAHLDLKPENLLIGADFNLKIADFDLSFVHGDSKVLSQGTKCYRAPELYTSGSAEARLKSLVAADIYSAGIILFILKSGGIYPHFEDAMTRGANLEELMYRNSPKFWEMHCELGGKTEPFYNRHFRELFNKMVKSNPFERASIEEIKRSRWYNGPVYDPEDFREKMEKILCH